MRDKEKQRQYNKEWYLRNAEKRKLYRFNYYLTHKELYKQHRENNKEKKKQWYADYALKNSEKLRSIAKERRYNRRKEMLSFLGGKCSCGFNDERALQIDHILGGGNKERESVGRGNFNLYLYRLMKSNPVAFIKKYQILCANCNWIKKSEKKE